MKNLKEIIYKNSHDTSDGLEIDFKDINGVIEKLENAQKENIKTCVLHMLEYCFNNVGNQNVNIEEEINKWINENN